MEDYSAKKQTLRRWAPRIIQALIFLLGGCLFFSSQWYQQTWGDMGFEAVIFTLANGATQAENSTIIEFWINTILPALGVTILTFVILWIRPKTSIDITFADGQKKRIFPFSKNIQTIVCITLSILFMLQAFNTFGIEKWLADRRQPTTIYADEYIKPTSENIVFEGEKRNLIYIYLESMETTFFSESKGGGLSYNVIPELYTLAEENLNFSHDEEIGGASNLTGCHHTSGAMIGSTSGLPCKTDYSPINEDRNFKSDMRTFYPGVTTLTNILHENGYYQTLMVGSDSHFGGRKEYYEQHNIDYVYDVATAEQDGVIEPGYRVWWGMEDEKLFQYAKQELTEISQRQQPFAFTMLTVDTHFVDGYICSLCENQYNEQYENVYACSSRQVYDFIQWLQTQDFYDDTTIIIAGDHLTMDNDYINRSAPEGYERHIYNCFINAAKEPVHNKNRVFTDLDMFPTTLSAMGATITGDRLGLGTDLFSAEQTLAEKYGMDVLDAELQKYSSDLKNIINGT